MNKASDYLLATRHPWPCLVFLFPWLLVYEAGILWLGGTQPYALRNGADTWLRWLLEAFGLHQLYWAPALIVVVFTGWSWLRRGDRPGDVFNVWVGMTVESGVFALGLWGLSRGLGPMLHEFGIQLTVAAPLAAPPRVEAAAQVLTFVGAGIYEEVLFRLLLFTGLLWLLRQIHLPPLIPAFLATMVSALLFSFAHHVGPGGERFDGYVFLFRTVAGMYFALLYLSRGFGVAVGAHACYDVLVGAQVE